MQVTGKHLVDLTRAGDWSTLTTVVSGLDEDERGALWTQLSHVVTGQLERDVPYGRPSDAWFTNLKGRSLLALALAPAAQGDDTWRWLVRSDPEPFNDDQANRGDRADVARLVAGRSPDWRRLIGEAWLEDCANEREPGLFGPMWSARWTSWRHLEARGLLHGDPADPKYLMLMVRGLLFSGDIYGGLRADPSLLEGPVWNLFTPDPRVLRTLLGSERYWDRRNTWRMALVRLATDGVIDADRLVEAATRAAATDGLGRGHRGWYTKIPSLLANPALWSAPPDDGPPPPGNQVR